MDSLIKFLRENAPSSFTPHAYYSHAGDSLIFYFDNPTCYYGERIDDFLTVYRSTAAGNQLVGCQIKGIPKALKLFGDFGLQIEDEFVQLSMIFLACMAVTNAPKEMKRFYFQLGEAAKGTSIPRQELIAA
jgi:hypothetical protein